MAMIYFAVGIHDILVEMQTEFDAEAELRGKPTSELGGIVSYADDINLSAPEWLLPRMFNTLKDKLEKARMEIKLSKCKILCPTSGRTPRLPDDEIAASENQLLHDLTEDLESDTDPNSLSP